MQRVYVLMAFYLNLTIAKRAKACAKYSFCKFTGCYRPATVASRGCHSLRRPPTVPAVLSSAGQSSTPGSWCKAGAERSGAERRRRRR